ncbi:hypothetical protein F5X96DRAFT_225374 [Biscogniauxia mediterranea]|nr:hypothetical protein F5X96DRAFT_225374 [Biscogniauxia mediterranea]
MLFSFLPLLLCLFAFSFSHNPASALFTFHVLRCWRRMGPEFMKLYPAGTYGMLPTRLQHRSVHHRTTTHSFLGVVILRRQPRAAVFLVARALLTLACMSIER